MQVSSHRTLHLSALLVKSPALCYVVNMLLHAIHRIHCMPYTMLSVLWCTSCIVLAPLEHISLHAIHSLLRCHVSALHSSYTTGIETPCMACNWPLVCVLFHEVKSLPVLIQHVLPMERETDHISACIYINLTQHKHSCSWLTRRKHINPQGICY